MIAPTDRRPPEGPMPQTCREQILEVLFDGRAPSESRLEALLDRMERAPWAS